MNFIGFVEHVDNMRIKGWVYSPDEDAAHLSVVATLDEIDIGSAVADILRKDLVELGFGRGDHAFEIAVAIPIKAEDCDAVEVFVVDAAGGRSMLRRVAGPASPPAEDLLAGRVTDPLADTDPFAGIDLQPSPAPVAPTVPVEDLLAGRATDPLADVDPFADLDLRRGAPVAPPPGERAPPSAGRDPVADNLQVFVLGAARSGTSVLFTAVSDVFGLPGYGESHVVPAFQRMIHQLRQYVEMFDNNPEDIMIKRMGAAPVEALLFDYVRRFYRETYKGGGFVDKTPTGEAIYGAPLIEAIFPDAFLIATRRTGIEVVQSFRLKFSSDFADACLAWAEAMSGILHARTRCQRMIEIDQFDMANQPERTGRRIAAWLGYPERGEALGRFFARERIEKSSSHDWSRRQTLADVDWSPTEKATFVRICGRMMETFEYAM